MKTILITGIDKGIGKATALKFLDEGFFVIGTTLFKSADFEHKNLKTFQMDLGEEESILNCAEEIKNLDNPDFSDGQGKIDILINNAGVMLDEDDKILDSEKLEKTLKINVVGTTTFTENILEEIKQQGHLIMITSSAGSLNRSEEESHKTGFYPAYKISKVALNMYVKTLALRMKDKLSISAVHPGCVKTDMLCEGEGISVEESAQDIFDFAITKAETGQFWYKSQKLPW